MIVTSLLDQDTYKFFMQQLVYHKFSNVETEWKYKLRNDNIIFDNKFISEFENEMSDLCSLRFKKDEIEYLKSLNFFKKDYLDFLELFQLQEKHIKLDTTNGFELKFKGPNLLIKMFEIFTMEIISELYNKTFLNKYSIINDAFKRLYEKIEYIEAHNKKYGNFKFADFGSRRRFSKSWHSDVLNLLIERIPNNLIGTSNMMFAKELNIKSIGTQAHSYFQMIQALVKLKDFQKYALQTWADEYRGSLGICLTDTICMDAFLKDFDLYFAKLFDGCRHDSGDPFVWCEKLIKHYKQLGIDPKTKTAIFSDGLDIPKAIKLFDTFKNRINVSFGIGTNLTNDVGIEPLNHVIKIIKVNNQDVAKISDSPGKTMCENESYVNYLKEVFNVRKEIIKK